MAKKKKVPKKSRPRKSITLGGDKAKEQLNRGLELLQGGRSAEAMALFQSILAENPDHTDALHLAGLVLHQNGDSARGAELMGRAVELHPQSGIYRINLGIAFETLGRLEEAEQQYREGVRLQPGLAQAHYNLGHVQTALGDLEGAVDSYREAVRLAPTLPEARANLGVALRDLGRAEEALPHLEKALQLRGHVDDHTNLAAAFHDLGRTEASEALYRRVLEHAPDHAQTLSNLGALLEDLGREEEAVTCLERAVRSDPNLAEASFNLGSILQQMDRKEEAEQHLRNALAADPLYPEAHYNLGLILWEREEPTDALNAFQEAVRLDPGYLEAHARIGDYYAQQNDAALAETAYRAAFDIDPEEPDAFSGLGLFLIGQERLEEAEALFQEAYRHAPESPEALVGLAEIYAKREDRSPEVEDLLTRALAIDPENRTALNGLGLAHLLQGRGVEAEALFNQALEGRPDQPMVINNLALAYKAQRRFPDAIEAFRRALEIDPMNAEAHMNLGSGLLQMGEYREGWRELGWRYVVGDPKPRDFPYPVWSGEELEGKTLLVYAEQGVGDEVMFASLLPEVIERAERVIVECNDRLVPLFQRSFPQADVRGHCGTGDQAWLARLPPVDCQSSIVSLASLLRRERSAFPPNPGHLVPDADARRAWRERLEGLGAGLKVGISWRGGVREAHRVLRRAALHEAWEPLFAVPGVHWVNLQYGACGEEIERAERETGVRIHHFPECDPLKDLDGFAAQVAELDMVISIDNSTVHMAGAVGVPTLVLLSYIHDWRWVDGEERTPWYETLNLISQEAQGVWEPVFAEAARRLQARLDS